MVGGTDDLSMTQIAEEWGVEEANLSALDEAIDTLDGLGVSYHIWTREQSEAFETLTGFEGNGWLCPVTISVGTEAGVNQSEALQAVLDALRALGVDVRLSLPGEGS